MKNNFVIIYILINENIFNINIFTRNLLTIIIVFNYNFIEIFYHFNKISRKLI